MSLIPRICSHVKIRRDDKRETSRSNRRVIKSLRRKHENIKLLCFYTVVTQIKAQEARDSMISL